MRSKVPLGKSSPRPNVQVNNYGRINSPGDDIRVAMAKNASKAGSPTGREGASVASCDGDDGDEAQGDDAEEDWPENGHDDSASGDELGAADIEEDEWWNQPVGSDDEVEEWRAGDSDNDGGEDAGGEDAEAQDAAVAADEAEAERETEAPADADAVAEADKVGADAVLFDGEGSDNDPWSLGTDDDVPLLKRRLRHRLQSTTKRARVVLSDDDSPGEDRLPLLTAAEKGKAKVVEAPAKSPAKAPAKAPARRRTSNKKRKDDGDPGSSKGAAKKKAKKAPNPDDIVNEALGSDDEYAAAAGPIPTFPEKEAPNDPTLSNPNTRPPSPRSKETTKKRRGWTVREKLNVACIRRWSLEAAAGIYKGAANCRKQMHGGGRHAHYPDMEAALYRYICLQRANGVAISVKDTQKWSREWMKKHHPGKNWNASSHWSQRFRDRWNLVMRVKTKIIIDAFRHCGISSKLDGTENHLVMSHLRARSTTDVSEDMSLGGTTGDNTRLLGKAPDEEDEEDEEPMQAEGVREVAVATGLEVLYQETPNYRGAAAEADRMIEPRETARHAWRVPDLSVEPVASAPEEAVTEGG
ncbi:unnamed protein product [Closterium sp. Yama58-4]|nr:unnamed protein product [Closterium sp. Yama58-4]